MRYFLVAFDLLAFVATVFFIVHQVRVYRETTRRIERLRALQIELLKERH